MTSQPPRTGHQVLRQRGPGGHLPEPLRVGYLPQTRAA